MTSPFYSDKQVLERSWGARPISTSNYAHLYRHLYRFNSNTKSLDMEQAAVNLILSKILQTRHQHCRYINYSTKCSLRIFPDFRCIRSNLSRFQPISVCRSKGILKRRASGRSYLHIYSYIPVARRAGTRKKQRIKKEDATREKA